MYVMGMRRRVTNRNGVVAMTITIVVQGAMNVRRRAATGITRTVTTETKGTTRTETI